MILKRALASIHAMLDGNSRSEDSGLRRAWDFFCSSRENAEIVKEILAISLSSLS